MRWGGGPDSTSVPTSLRLVRQGACFWRLFLPNRRPHVRVWKIAITRRRSHMCSRLASDGVAAGFGLEFARHTNVGRWGTAIAKKANMTVESSRLPEPFAGPYAPPDEDIAARLLAARPDMRARDEAPALARDLIRAVRERRGGIGGVEDFLHEFALSSREGLAVMALAEVAVAGAGRRHRRSADRRQIGLGGFSPSRGVVRGAARSRLRFRARRVGAARRAGRVPARPRRRSRAAARYAGPARRRAAGDAAHGRAFRAWRDD